MSSPAEATEARSRPRGRFRGPDLLVPVLIAVAILGILELIPMNYYALMPGQALTVEPMISVKGYPLHHTRGRLYMTDVSLYKVNHLLEWLYEKLNPDAELYPAHDVAGNLNEKQYLAYNAALMDDSIERAEAAALEVTRGYHLTYSTAGPEVVFVLPGVPAANVLLPGDIIEAIDGHRVHTAAAVRPLVERVRPGTALRVTVLRGHRRLVPVIRTVASTNGEPNRHGKTPLLGIQVRDKLVFPIKVSINAGSIGGPSAGLMFTLGIVQRLEQRDITKGCRVAGTGTIDFNGAVGAIGGAKQKIIAARSVGARYFLVPKDPGNVHDAMSAKGSITVVPVATLAQAMAFLKHITPCK